VNSKKEQIVLVVESHGPMASSLKAIIERLLPNFEVEICENADEVTKQMEKVRSKSPQTKFIVMSGDSRDAKVNVILTKPYTFDNLQKTINAAIGQLTT